MIDENRSFMQPKDLLLPSTDADAESDSALSLQGSTPPINSSVLLHTPPTCTPSTPYVDHSSSLISEGDQPSIDSGGFLIALATQERRVLELKEELQKAEADLQCLKEKWAAHEALGEKINAKGTTSQQMTAITASKYVPQGSTSTAMNIGRGQQNSVVCNPRISHRKMFQGSRHTRTLSLLAQTTTNTDVHASWRRGSLANTVDAQANNKAGSSINASSFAVPAQAPNVLKDIFRGSDKDMLVETGKQMVGDFRQGFWTFVDDLKQVTVGDDASGPMDSLRTPPPGAFKYDARTLIDDGIIPQHEGKILAPKSMSNVTK